MLGKFLKFIDLFGYTIGFKHDNTDRFKSIVGGIITVVYILAFIASFAIMISYRELNYKVDLEYKE